MYKRLLILITLIMISCDEDDTKGCTNLEGCNYNSNASVDDGSCYYCFEGDCDTYPKEYYDCDGNCINDNCFITCSTPELPNNIIFINHLNNQEIELGYSVSAATFGFQFDIYGISIDNDIISGDTDNAGLTIVYSNFPDEGFVRILGYCNDFENSDLIYLIAGCGTLLSFSYEGNIKDIRNIIFGGHEGPNIPMTYYP